jgi:hypothetical protein
MILRFIKQDVHQRGAGTQSRPSLSPGSIVILILVLALSKSFVRAQIGTTICICSPSAYVMQLNFSSNCENDSLVGEGILTSDCAIDPFQNPNVTDEVPVSVSSIDLLELDVDLGLLTQSSRFGSFNDGDIIQFVSVSGDPSVLNETYYPKALQISMTGNNVAGDTLYFAGLIIYSTDCNQFPLIEEGSSIGWVTLVRRDLGHLMHCTLHFSFLIHFDLSPIPFSGAICGSFECSLSTGASFKRNTCTYPILISPNFTNSSSISNSSSIAPTDTSPISDNSKYSNICPTKIDFITSSDQSIYQVPISKLSLDQSAISQ